MFVLLNGKRFEPSLPDVPARGIVAMIAADVRRQEPLHPAAQIAILPGPDDQMEMVGHEAVCEHPHPVSREAGLEQIGEGGVVPRLVKDGGAPIAAIDDVIAEAPDRGPSRARHARTLGTSARGIKN
jgi:hypothetical protein